MNIIILKSQQFARVLSQTMTLQYIQALECKLILRSDGSLFTAATENFSETV